MTHLQGHLGIFRRPRFLITGTGNFVSFEVPRPAVPCMKAKCNARAEASPVTLLRRFLIVFFPKKTLRLIKKQHT